MADQDISHRDEPLEGQILKALRKLGFGLQSRPAREKASEAIEPGEAWADAALQDLQSMTVDERVVWAEILHHAWSANGSKPSQKWLKEAEGLLGQNGKQAFVERVGKWLSLMSQP